MDCRKAQLLITLRLDGAISSEEECVLAAHLAGCEACSREATLQEMIAGALREVGRDEMQAPPELCGLVMNRLRSESGVTLAWLPVKWRKAMAAAAALLIVAGSAAGITASLNVPGDGKVISFESQVKTDAGTGERDTGINNPLAGSKNAPGASVEITATDSEAVAASGAGDSTGSTATQGGESMATERAGGSYGGATEIASTNTYTGRPQALSSNMKITSTVLKVAVDDLTGARAKAVALAAGAGAATQVFPEQGGGKKITVIRITIEPNRAPALIAELTNLGTLNDRQDESRDVTGLYNEAMVQYSDIQSRLSSASDAAMRQQMETQAASYKRQLDSWEAEAGKRVIMLWLESR
ncbi:MAG: hypothetical protein A4E53_01442 [Pelotomaculum sp. PtaB.Bin104]|nr:MAG: hypothetical protein A4E53_01442 [Pelotomaculum sp. PtaB.Bin104]